MERISDTQRFKTGELTGPRNRNIFISYASEAEEWAEKLVSLLRRPGWRVDRATVDATNHTDMTRNARGNGGYACLVMLITPGFLRSPRVQSAFSTFIEGGVQSVPVYGIRLVGDPIEQSWMPGGLEVALLPRDPVTIFESEDPDTLLAQIAAEIRMGVDRRLAEMEARQESGDAWGAPSAFAGSESSGAPDPLRELLSHYKVSYSVGAVLVHAAEYAAAASPPAVLSTSLVLLTLAEHGARKAAPMWVGDWLRTRLGDAFDEMRGGYFDEKRIPGEARTDGRVERLRAGVALTLDRARGLALRTTPTAEIRGRHLLAAMLTDERPNAGALKQLRRAGLNQSGLRADLYDFVRAYGDDDEAWGDILLGPVAADARLSGFHADDSRSVDYLDVRPDVEAFGKLIAARTVEPPLSIGLFGEWGSGKTFFMRMLQGEVNRLAQLADSSGRMQCDLPYWKRIIQIEFNAWHYVEENLWASLANRLFEALHNTDPRSASWSFRQQLERQRDHERSLADRAEEEKHAAEVETTNAEAEFLAAQRQFARLSATATTASGKSLLAAVDAAAVRRAVAGPLQQLGLLRLEGSAADLIGELDRAGNELGRVRGVLAPLFRGPRRERLHRAALLAAAVLGAPAVGFVLYAIIDRVGPEGWARVAGLAGGAAGILGTGKAWIRKQLAVVRLWRTEVESAKRRVDSVLVEEYDRLREAESRRGKLQVAAEAARQGLEEARDRLAKAEARLRSASLAEELTRFVSERFGSGDYRSQLSTLARVREDFERLSELIEEENWRLTPTLQGEDTSRRGLRKFETLEEEAGDRGARVNRIVLYIDDLDRCPPAKVVEVLQAVHLLLAFPLFVVVVGVDARWVVRSVDTRYRELLRAGRAAEEHGAEGDDLLARVGTATAHDYLEKIFQIPFWLRSMTDRACQSMVRGLLASSVPLEPDGTAPPPVPRAPRDLAVNPSPTKSEEGDRDSAAQDGGGMGAPRLGPDRGPSLTAANGGLEATEETRPVSAPELREAEPRGSGEQGANLSPGALQIQRVEVEAIEELAPLLGRSPRALKRFVNVYRLIKASLTPYERQVFLGSDMLPDYLAVLFLLAVDTGAPSAASAVFSAIRDLSAPLFFKLPEEMRLAQPHVLSNGPSGAPRTLADLVTRLDVDPKLKADADWARVRHWLVSGDDTYRLPNDLGRLARWVPRVSRYSFHTGRMERPHRPAVDLDALETNATS